MDYIAGFVEIVPEGEGPNVWLNITEIEKFVIAGDVIIGGDVILVTTRNGDRWFHRGDLSSFLASLRGASVRTTIPLQDY